MANYNGRFEIQVTDINGDTAQVSVPLRAADTVTLATLATDTAAIVTALEPVTNGKITRQSIRFLFGEAQYLVGTAPPNDAEYSSVTDGARLQFANGSGDRTAMTIPAPVEAVFGTNSNVVDSTVTAVATLIGVIQAQAVDPTGNPYNLYKGGVKTGRHARRRATRLIP